MELRLFRRRKMPVRRILLQQPIRSPHGFRNVLIRRVIRIHPIIRMICRKSPSKLDLSAFQATSFSSLLSRRLVEGYRDDNKDTSDDDSVESTKTGEQETFS